MSRVGEKIKQARMDSKMTQKQLAKKLGVSEGFVNEVESGKKIINESFISRISKILNKEINDISISFEEQTYENEPKVEKKKYLSFEKENKKDKKEINEVWSEAFGDVLKNVPIYNYDLNNILGHKQMPVSSNKIEGHAQDKVFYLMIEDDDMIGFRIVKGDMAFCHGIKEFENNSICLLEYNDMRVIRQVKRLDNSKALLISNKGNIKTETVLIKDIKVIAKLDRIEIKL